MVSALNSGVSSPGSSPGQGHYTLNVWSRGKQLVLFFRESLSRETSGLKGKTKLTVSLGTIHYM